MVSNSRSHNAPSRPAFLSRFYCYVIEIFAIAPGKRSWGTTSSSLTSPVVSIFSECYCRFFGTLLDFTNRFLSLPSVLFCYIQLLHIFSVPSFVNVARLNECLQSCCCSDAESFSLHFSPNRFFLSSFGLVGLRGGLAYFRSVPFLTIPIPRVQDVPNGQFRHIILANNENKPVTNSRDTQEVSRPLSVA